MDQALGFTERGVAASDTARRTAAEDVWRVIRRHDDVWNELTRRGLDPHQDEPDYRHWKRV
jgi:hypothetical protein